MADNKPYWVKYTTQFSTKASATPTERREVARRTRAEDRDRRKQLKKEGKKQRPLQKMDVREGARARALRGGPDYPSRYSGATTPKEQRLLARVKSRTRKAKGGLGTAIAIATILASKLSKKKDKGAYSTPAMAMATRHALTVPGAKTNIPGIEKRRGR